MLWLALALLLAPPLALLFLAAGLALGAAGRTRTADGVEPRKTALVLGAKIRAPGEPTALLADRLDTAAELLRLGKVERLLLSGDGGTGRPDEVETMRRYLVSLGVREEALVLDRESPRTLASLIRARGIFGERSLIVVTNPFHLPRALFLAKQLGLDALGVPAKARRPVSARKRLFNSGRERVAQLRALWDVVRGRAR
ncbi:MAG: SanA/YdcF family protein [Myxococcales bacterium]|jgi:SanA protein